MPDRLSSPSVITPTIGVDPRVALATSLHAAPGLYAVLVGSGMSRAAGIPTGWEVVQDLARKVALAEGVDLSGLGQAPEEWFAARFERDLRYDEVLLELTRTDPERQAVLRSYFDPPPSAGGPIQPTAGHHALATLCSTGRVRVVLTTNFDRLIERAIAEAGVAVQVLATTDDLTGMIPLQHAPATVIKLHGDYMSKMRNAPDELATYPADLRCVLDRVLDEYGLMVIGWSADYDTALRNAIAACSSHRYPTYWMSYAGALGEAAERLIRNRSATVINTAGADEFLVDLVDRITRLEHRAARRGRPALVRQHHFSPRTYRPNTSSEAPLLLRAAVMLGPAALDECGQVGPSERERMLRVLAGSDLTGLLVGASAMPPMPRAAEGTAASAPRANAMIWGLAPDGWQSDVSAQYSIGAHPGASVAALLSVELPGAATGSVVLVLDTSMSTTGAFRIGQAARLWCDALVLLTSSVPEALGGVLPTDAEPMWIELHAISQKKDEHGQQTDLTGPLDLTTLGERSGSVGDAIGVAMRISGALSRHEAAEVVSDAITCMALAHGYLDPRIGLNVVRGELGLPAKTLP
jgi:SIR2-like domain